MLTGFKGIKYGLQPGVKAKQKGPAGRPLAAFIDDDGDGDAPSVGKDIARQAAKKRADAKVRRCVAFTLDSGALCCRVSVAQADTGAQHALVETTSLQYGTRSNVFCDVWWTLSVVLHTACPPRAVRWFTSRPAEPGRLAPVRAGGAAACGGAGGGRERI